MSRTFWNRLSAYSPRRGRGTRSARRAAYFRPALEPLEGRQLLSIFTETNIDDAGAGSLRQAILDANANPGADTIAFQISGAGVHTIQLASPLPTLTGVTVVDGTTQSDYAGVPLVELNGSAAATAARDQRVCAGSDSQHQHVTP
jgi:hypothetical protein